MASIDPFSAEIVSLVRNMSAEAILALVKNQLGNVKGASIAAARASTSSGRGKPGRKPGRVASQKKAAAKKAAPTSPAASAPQAAAAKKKPGRKPGRPKAAAKAAAPKAAAPKAKAAAAKPMKAAPKAKAPKAAKGKRGGRSSAGRQELLGAVERVVKGGNGMSASEIAKSAGVPQTRVTSALKELKLAKRIFQGGDRRFARYAGDARSAEQASVAARQNASGPVVAKKGKRK